MSLKLHIIDLSLLSVAVKQNPMLCDCGKLMVENVWRRVMKSSVLAAFKVVFKE